MTPAQAKKFFIDKIKFQAVRENIRLSEAEEYMLSWSETEEFAINQTLLDKFNEETTDKEFEKKITNLIKHAFEFDIKRDSEMEETYRSAYYALKTEDHYILIMIEDGIGSILEKFGLLSRIFYKIFGPR